MKMKIIDKTTNGNSKEWQPVPRTAWKELSQKMLLPMLVMVFGA